MELIEIDETTLLSSEVNYADISNICHNKLSSLTSYDAFFTQYLIANRPCIIQADIVNTWPCAQKWRLHNAPNFKYLEHLYGKSKVPVANCAIKYFNAQLKDEMTVEKFLNYWEKYRANNCPPDMPILYLKDWHCLRDNPNSVIYKVPKFFASDWLNEYYLAHPELADDYMFVYMGPKGSWTPLHVDVFTSYSWSANVVGRKRWLMFPPGEEKNLCDAHGHLPYDIDLHKNLNYTNDKSFEIIQGPGEIIFVPSGWHHQVWNLEDTISINHNWINSCNIFNVWIALKKALMAVMKEIEDCRSMDDWEMHCQVILKASHGMNYLQFYDFMSFIMEKRLAALDKNKACTSFGIWELGFRHVLYDLYRAKYVLQNLIEDAKEKNIYGIVFSGNRPEDLISSIESKLALF